MAESGIEIDIEQYLNMDTLDYDGSFGELKSSSFVEKPMKTEVKNASTPLKVNLKMQLMKQQAQEEQKRITQSQNARTVSASTAITMPITLSALTSDVPQQVMQVKSGLTNPTRYHVQQKRNYQIQTYLSQSVKSPSHMGQHSLPGVQMHNTSSLNTPTMNQISQLRLHSSSSMPDPTSPLSVMSSSLASCGSGSEVDDLLGDILSLEQVDTANEQELSMLLQLSSTVPPNEISSEQVLNKQTSASAPNELIAWQKDRQRKDNHNQIERKRRYNINDRIKELGTLLPNTNDPDFRQNKGTILKASVDYIRELKRDQQKLREMEDRMQEQERQNRLIMLRLQQCEMMLKQTTIVQNNMNIVATENSVPVKMEPTTHMMEDDFDNPVANDLMLSASLTSPDSFIDDTMNSYE